MNLFPVYPLQNITLTRAQGARVFDEQGKAYLDFYGGHAVMSLGHNHPAWKKRLLDQLEKISFYSNSVHLPIQRELADTLGRVAQKPNYQLFLVNSGAEANENALKLASFVTGRNKIIAFKKAFHGRTSLAVAATDNPSIVAPVNQTSHIDFLPFNDSKALNEYFARFKNEPCNVAAIIVEAIQGVGGIQVATPDFLKTIYDLAHAHGALIIADEVQCGFGRSGHFFAFDAIINSDPSSPLKLQADLYTMAKGMGNGFPIGGVAISPNIEGKHGMLGTTFGGNPLACAASLAVLEVIEKDNLLSRAQEMGNDLMNRLNQLAQKYPGTLTGVRGLGLMVGFDLPESLKHVRQNLLMKHSIFTGEAKPNTVRLLPMLTIEKPETDEFLHALEKEIQGAHQ